MNPLPYKPARQPASSTFYRAHAHNSSTLPLPRASHHCEIGIQRVEMGACRLGSSPLSTRPNLPTCKRESIMRQYNNSAFSSLTVCSSVRVHFCVWIRLVIKHELLVQKPEPEHPNQENIPQPTKKPLNARIWSLHRTGVRQSILSPVACWVIIDPLHGLPLTHKPCKVWGEYNSSLARSS